MNSIHQIKKELKGLIVKGITETLERLREILLTEPKKYNQVVLLEARYKENRKKLLEGLIEDNAASVEFNKIRECIIEIIESISKKDLLESIKVIAEKLNYREGCILYRIPKTMQSNREIKCGVKIAFSKDDLIKNIILDDKDIVKELRRTSDIMSVELIDPKTKIFEIRTITEQIQFLDKGDYTEWIFYVKPLMAGEFSLILKVSVIEIIDNKERKKDLVLEETIQVTTSENTEIKSAFKIVSKFQNLKIYLSSDKSKEKKYKTLFQLSSNNLEKKDFIFDLPLVDRGNIIECLEIILRKNKSYWKITNYYIHDFSRLKDEIPIKTSGDYFELADNHNHIAIYMFIRRVELEQVCSKLSNITPVVLNNYKAFHNARDAGTVKKTMEELRSIIQSVKRLINEVDKENREIQHFYNSLSLSIDSLREFSRTFDDERRFLIIGTKYEVKGKKLTMQFLSLKSNIINLVNSIKLVEDYAKNYANRKKDLRN